MLFRKIAAYIILLLRGLYYNIVMEDAMKLGFCVPMNDEWKNAVQVIQKEFPDIELVLGVDTCLEQFSDLDAVVANAIDHNYYIQSNSLKAVFVPFVGINHLPIDVLRTRNIAVYNCHGNAFSVAERALAMTLAGFGRIIEFHNDLKNGKWHGFWVGKGREDYWESIEGKKCVILGTGAIGQKLAMLCKAFSCSVIGFKRTPSTNSIPGFDMVTTNLDEALAGAEIVYITLPLTEHTKHLITARELKRMQGAWLTNVGRGEIIEEEALYIALKDGTLRGAAIDVWYTYPEKGSEYGHPSRFPIHELSNVVLSPHVAGSTWQAVIHNIEQTRDNIIAFLRTGKGLYPVNLIELY